MKAYLLLPLILVGLLFSCNEKVLSSGKSNLKIKDAFTQKEVPGQAEGTVRDYLKLNLNYEDAATTKITEVVFRNRSYSLSSNRADLKFDLAKGSVDAKNSSLKNNEAKIFYTMDGKNYVLTVQNIVAKPPLYLP